MAGFAQIYSTAIEQPREVILPVEPAPAIGENKADIVTRNVAPPAAVEDLEFQEQEVPEGVTVTKWEEWAYVSINQVLG